MQVLEFKKIGTALFFSLFPAGEKPGKSDQHNLLSWNHMREKWSPWKQYANHLLVGFLVILIFICALDFWNWNKYNLSFFGFPQWVWYSMVLTFLLSIIYFFIVRYLWREESF